MVCEGVTRRPLFVARLAPVPLVEGQEAGEDLGVEAHLRVALSGVVLHLGRLLVVLHEAAAFGGGALRRKGEAWGKCVVVDGKLVLTKAKRGQLTISIPS